MSVTVLKLEAKDNGIDTKIDDVSVADALVMVGKGTPDDKITGWLKLGKEIQDARSRFKVASRCARNVDYEQWLIDTRIKTEVAENSRSWAANIYANRDLILRLRATEAIPSNWCSPGILHRTIKWVNEGKDPREEEKKRQHSKKKPDTVQGPEEGTSDRYFWDGKGFRDLMMKLPDMPDAEREHALEQFFGTTASGIKAKHNEDGSITVTETAPVDPPKAATAIELTIRIIMPVETNDQTEDNVPWFMQADD